MFQQTGGMNYIEIMYKRKAMIIFITLLTIIMVIIGNETLIPIYEAETKVLIEGAEEEMPYEIFGEAFLGEKSSKIKTEIEIILSNPIIEEVVRRLKLDKREVPLTWIDNLLDGINSFIANIRSLFVKKEEGEVKRTLSPFRKTVNDLKKNIKIEQMKSTDILDITVEDYDDYMSAKIANTLVRVYMDQCLDIKCGEARNTYYFITEQLKIMKPKLEKFEEALENFKKGAKTISLPEEVKSQITSLASFEADYYKLQAEKKELEKNYENLTEKIKLQDERIISSTTIAEDPIIKSLKAELTNLDVGLPTLLKKYGKNHPKIIETESMIEQTTLKLKDAVEKIITAELQTLNPIHEDIKQKLIMFESEITALDAKGKALLTTIDSYKSEFENLAEKELILARLTREVELTQKMYESLLEQQQEAMIAEAIKIGNVRVVEPALIPIKPIIPNKILNLLIGLVVALMFGITLAFMSEYLNHSFKTHKDIEEYLKLPVLGLIPMKK